MKSQDWRLAPIAFASWLGAFLGVSLGKMIWAIAISCLALGCVFLIKRNWLAPAVVTLAFFAGLTGVLAQQRMQSQLVELSRQQAEVRVEVRIVSEPIRRKEKAKWGPTNATALGELYWVENHDGRVQQLHPVLLSAAGDEVPDFLALQTGASYEFRAHLVPARNTAGYAAILRVKQIGQQNRRPNLLQAGAAVLRQWLREAMSYSSPAQAAIVPSLVVGDTSGVDAELTQAFRTTGLTHLMAVSGANLALMLGVILAAARLIGLRGWYIRIVGAFGVGGFILICGPEPSVLRAAVMGLVAIVAVGVGTGRKSIRALSFAVLLLMALDPWLSWAVGFWLSFLACLGIVLVAPNMIQAISRWAPSWLAEAFAIPISAQLFTQPVVTWLSNEVSLIGVLANVLSAPFVGPTTVLGFAAALVGWFPMLSHGVGWAAGWCATPIILVAQWGSALPQARIEAVGGAVMLAALTLLCILGLWALPRLLRNFWASLAMIVLLIVVVSFRAPQTTLPANWEAAFCDVGQGDATVLRAGENSAVLVDTGPESASLIDCLRKLGITDIPLVIITHYHADHIGGLPALLASYSPRMVLVCALPSPAAAADRVAKLSRSSKLQHAVAGEHIRVGEVEWLTVSAWSAPDEAVEPGLGESTRENNASIIGLATVGELRLLLPGDAEPAGQREALRSARRLGIDLSADVLKLPHHGSSRQERDFFSSTRARLGVVSAGRNNEYGHPARKTLELAHSLGMGIVGTNSSGSLVLDKEETIQTYALGG